MPEKIVHDQALYEELAARAEALAPAVRRAKMFGSPALYMGRKLAASVFGEDVVLHVPEEIALREKAEGRASAFRPYGKQEMREWIALEGGIDALDAMQDLLESALAFAAANDTDRQDRG